MLRSYLGNNINKVMTLKTIFVLLCGVSMLQALFAMTELQQKFESLKKNLQAPDCLDPILENYVQNAGLININKLQKTKCTPKDITSILNQADQNQTNFGKYPQPHHFIYALSKIIPWIIKNTEDREIIIKNIEQETIKNHIIRKNILNNFIADLKSVKKYYYSPETLKFSEINEQLTQLNQILQKLEHTSDRIKKTSSKKAQDKIQDEIIESVINPKLKKFRSSLRSSLTEQRKEIQNLNKMLDYMLAIGIGALGLIFFILAKQQIKKFFAPHLQFVNRILKQLFHMVPKKIQ
jgi:hypothetical protein